MKEYNCLVCGDMGQVELDKHGMQTCPHCHGMPITPGSTPITLWFSVEALLVLQDLFPADSPEESLKQAIVYAGLRHPENAPMTRVDLIYKLRGGKPRKYNWLQRALKVAFKL